MDATMMVITMVVTTTMAIPVMMMMMDITMTVINALDHLPTRRSALGCGAQDVHRAASIRPPAQRTLRWATRETNAASGVSPTSHAVSHNRRAARQATAIFRTLRRVTAARRTSAGPLRRDLIHATVDRLRRLR